MHAFRAPIAACLATLAFGASAAPFSPGNLVVYRAGTGTNNLVPTGNAVFLDEYTTSGALVQSIAMPAAASGANRPLVASGTATSDGLLTRSADGTCLAVPGYGRAASVTVGNLTSTTPTIPRVVARVNADATFDSSTGVTDSSVGTNFRGAATNDCTGFYLSGNAGGVRYAALGATSSADLTTASFGTERGIGIFSGQLYVASPANAVNGIARIGTGLPTTGAQVITKLDGTAASTSPYSFFLADLDPGVPGNDTLYIADDAIGLMKFSLVGGIWTASGTIASTEAYRGLTATVQGRTVTLYATRKGGSTAAGGGELVKLVDSSGYNGTLSGTPALLASAAANTAFRGVALAPGLVTITPQAGANGALEPATAQIIPGGVAQSFKVKPAPGYSFIVTGCGEGSTLVGDIFTTEPATKNCTVVASFARFTHKVTPSAGEHGTITPSLPQDIPEDASGVFTVVAAPGYRASVGGTCHGTLDGTTYTTAPILADCTVDATFTLITFDVTASAGANGTISPAGTQPVPQGTQVTYTVTPAHGFGASVGGTCTGTLTGNTYVTAPVTNACTVEASFPLLPRYTVNATANAHGAISPAGGQVVIAGDTASITITPDAGYNYAVRGTCGGALQGNAYVTRAASADCTVNVTFARKLVLFVGNSYTFGRVDPVMSYNAANVADLTYPMWLANPVGSNEDEPHPWGGIPGVFKKLIDQAGLDWDVSISARNAASLRGHYLNSNPAGWDLRGNVASQRFDIVMLQDLSDEPLPPGRGANANLAYFNAYVDKLEQWAHDGAAQSYTETQLFGGTTAACRAATGASANTCDTLRVTPANGNARSAAEVYLYQTWARPDMIGPNGTNENGLFYSAAEGLEAMTADFHAAYFGRAAANGNIEDVAPVGDAFLRAVQSGVAMRDPYVPEAGKVNLWHTDFFHPSKYGSYLSALVHFATLTGYNPLMLGGGEQAAADLGIAPPVAVQLQKVAQATVSPDVTAPVSAASVSQPANANGWNTSDVTVTFTATDEDRGSGLDFISYELSGAQTGSARVASGASVKVSAEGVTTITYYAQDRAGNAEAARTLRLSIDRTPPAITGMPGADCTVWPANRRMVQVAAISASGGASPLASFTVAATSSEAARAGESDIVVAGTGDTRTVTLRADREASGSGRVYTINVTATDAAGNSASAAAICRVPHDLGK